MEQSVTGGPFSRIVTGELPVDVERDEARRLARQELANPIYQDEPPLSQRILEWVLRRLDEVIAAAGEATGGLAVLLVLLPLAIVVAVVLWRTGPMARRAARSERSLFGAKQRSAAEYRRAGDEAFAAGDWTVAVLERFRATVAGLTERDILTARPGRTADEAAREAGRLLPSLAGRLVRAAETFDDVRYGGRAASRDEAVAMGDLERDVRAARITGEPATNEPAPAVPR